MPICVILNPTKSGSLCTEGVRYVTVPEIILVWDMGNLHWSPFQLIFACGIIYRAWYRCRERLRRLVRRRSVPLTSLYVSLWYLIYDYQTTFQAVRPLLNYEWLRFIIFYSRYSNKLTPNANVWRVVCWCNEIIVKIVKLLIRKNLQKPLTIQL
jgi:hypothetical protein